MCDVEVAEGTETQAAMDSYQESASQHYTEHHLPTSPCVHENLCDWQSVGPMSQDGGSSASLCIQLEEKWILWHKFMMLHSSFIDWLQLAEKSTASPECSHLSYASAKQELKRFEALRSDTGARLLQLDDLAEQLRVLGLHFGGPVGRRLVSMVRDCSQRWDRVSQFVEGICRELELCVSEREEFETQREEMAIWLADMNLRLTEVEHFSGRDNLEKMQQLQDFQEAVGENTLRLNGLLERGEVLMQSCHPADAHDIEASLQELLQYCGGVFEGVGQLHTRLLSMRLVFEEDWLLAPPPDSGCPSEALQEDDDITEQGSSSHVQGPPTPPGSDHQVLEWDPSVDIGGSVSFDDADSSYFSAITGLNCAEEWPSKQAKRRSHLSSNGSQFDMATDETPDTSTESHADCGTPFAFANTLVPGAKVGDDPQLCPLETSSAGKHLLEPVTFDPERISTWLGHIPVIHERKPCSKAVQTEHNLECLSCSVSRPVHSLSRPGSSPDFGECPTPWPPPSRDHEPLPLRTSCRRHANPQPSKLKRCQQETASEAKINIDQRHEGIPLSRKGFGSWAEGATGLPRLLRASILLYVLIGLLLAGLIWALPGGHVTSCHYRNTLNRSFHLMLRYVNGPPPT